MSAQQLPVYFGKVPYLPLRTGYQFEIKRTVTAFCGSSAKNAVKEALIGAKVYMAFINQAGIYCAKKTTLVKVGIQRRIELYPVYAVVQT